MPNDAAIHARLRASIQSRQRAWDALQGIRRLLTSVGECDLGPTARPPRFETEGKILRQAIGQTILSLRRDIEQLEKAIEGVRPFLANPDHDPRFPLALFALNRAVQKAKIEIAELRRLAIPPAGDPRPPPPPPRERATVR